MGFQRGDATYLVFFSVGEMPFPPKPFGQLPPLPKYIFNK
jgi:hypothetical protein